MIFPSLPHVEDIFPMSKKLHILSIFSQSAYEARSHNMKLGSVSWAVANGGGLSIVDSTCFRQVRGKNLVSCALRILSNCHAHAPHFYVFYRCMPIWWFFSGFEERGTAPLPYYMSETLSFVYILVTRQTIGSGTTLSLTSSIYSLRNRPQQLGAWPRDVAFINRIKFSQLLEIVT